MKQVYVIFHSSRVFKFNIFTIHNPKEYDLILVTLSSNKINLTNEYYQVFNDILFTDSFNVDAIVNVLQDFISYNNQNVTFITHEETSILLVSRLCELFGVGGLKENEALKFTNKVIMKEILYKNGISLPKYIRHNPDVYNENKINYVKNIYHALSMPICAKPIDGTCSENVSKINCIEELSLWCEEHSTDYNFELDEFLDGDLFHIDSVIYNGKAVFTGVCKYAAPNAEFVNGKVLGSYMLNENEIDYGMLSSMNEKVLRVLSPTNGITHMEVFKSQKHNDFIFLEIATRPPGASIPKMYEYNYNINLQELFFKFQMGYSASDLKINQILQNSSQLAWLWIPKTKVGYVKTLIIPSIKSKLSIKWHIVQNELVEKKSVSVRDRVCEVFIENENYEQLKYDFNYLKNFNFYDVK